MIINPVCFAAGFTAGCVVTLSVARLLRFIRRAAAPGEDGSQDAKNPKADFAYICELCEFESDMDRYLNSNIDIQYASEADRYGTLAIEAPQSEEAKSRTEVLKKLLQYKNMPPEDRGIIHYNLARIAKAQGDNTACVKHLEAAKEDIPRVLLSRLKMDPLFGNPPTAG